MAVLVAALAVVIALLAVLVAGILRSHAEILRSLHALGVNLDPDAASATPASGVGVTIPRPRDESRPATDIVGVTPSGDAANIAVVGARHSTLLAFLTSGCSTCSEFWSAFADPRLKIPGDARLVVVTKGEEGESPSRLRKFVPHGAPVVMSSDAWAAYDVPVAPYFVYVDGLSARVVGEGAASTWPHLAGMMEQALADAGIAAGRTPRGGRGRGLDGRARAERVDRDLMVAGIEPGHPSLYPAHEADLSDGGGA
jgi:hypothetical protein